MWKFTNKYVPNNTHGKISKFSRNIPPTLNRDLLVEETPRNVVVIVTIELGILITDKSFSSETMFLFLYALMSYFLLCVTLYLLTSC